MHLGDHFFEAFELDLSRASYNGATPDLGGKPQKGKASHSGAVSDHSARSKAHKKSCPRTVSSLFLLGEFVLQ